MSSTAPSSILLVPPSPPPLLIEEVQPAPLDRRLLLGRFLARHGPLLVLALLTLAGGAIRFARLSAPCLWGDEANVYWRSIGTYRDMLSMIRDEGFGPLHYELYWLILRSVRRPEPWIMRFAPALCGTLMIPAMYFLARQLLPRRTALAAAAITACSGFLIFYSRDCKMYAENWLFLTLSGGGLLWWFRTRSLTAWLTWVACGAISCGIHVTALAIVALSPLLLLTQAHLHWKTALAWLAGAVLILAGPVGYYFTFNRWNANVEDHGWQHSGIEWVENENAGRSGPDLVRCTATSFLMGWTWPRQTDLHDVDPWRFTAARWCAELLLAVGIVSLLPWPLRERPPRTGRDAPPQPQWRVLLWICIWVVLPGYALYCRSVADFASPADWFDSSLAVVPTRCQAMLAAHAWIGWLALAAVSAAIVALLRKVPPIRSVLLRGLQCALVAAAIIGACAAIYHICAAEALKAELMDRPWQSIWMPRYLGFIWPGAALGAAALLMRLPTRPIRAAALLLLCAVNLAFGIARIAGDTEPPVQQMAADAFVAEPRDSVVRSFFDIRHGDGRPGEGTIYTMPGRYYLQLLAHREPMSPGRFIGLITEFRLHSHVNAAEVVGNIRRSPNLRRLIVWDDLPLKTAATVDTIAPQLHHWRLVREQTYLVHDFWTWEDLAQYRRREYQFIQTPKR